MPITEDLELPLTYIPISGPGVDALERRKECGSLGDTEAEANERFREYLRSDLHKANMAAFAEFVRKPIRF